MSFKLLNILALRLIEKRLRLTGPSGDCGCKLNILRLGDARDNHGKYEEDEEENAAAIDKEACDKVGEGVPARAVRLQLRRIDRRAAE